MHVPHPSTSRARTRTAIPTWLGPTVLKHLLLSSRRRNDGTLTVLCRLEALSITSLAATMAGMGPPMAL